MILILYLFYQIKKQYLYKTPLCLAIESNNNEIAKLLISHPNIDINKPYILNITNSYNFELIN
mgnify:CR=1 FL=1